MPDGYVASQTLRGEARQLAELKLTGERLREAKQFIYRSRRTEREIDALMAPAGVAARPRGAGRRPHTAQGAPSEHGRADADRSGGRDEAERPGEKVRHVDRLSLAVLLGRRSGRSRLTTRPSPSPARGRAAIPVPFPWLTPFT